MPVDYSKWDALELSDDSDIEVHPNVDKRSFIRAKQNQIHQDRYQRKQEIETLKYERMINDGLLARIDRLISSLNTHASHASSSSGGNTSSPDELVFQSLIESAGDPADDQPPAPPAGVHTNVKEQPSYSKMMAALVDQVKKTVDEERKPSTESERIAAFGQETTAHKTKVLNLQQELLKRLAELEKLEGSKITSESYSTGFSSSSVSKTGSATEALNKENNNKSSSFSTKAKDKKQKGTTTTTQLLNSPMASKTEANDANSSGSEADTEDTPLPSPASQNPEPTLPSPIKDRTVHPTNLGLQFSALPPNAYQAYLNFIAEHPSVLAERETDGLLMRAFDLQYANKPTESRHAVHQALLLQYCRSLGKDGVSLFFKRVTSPGHQARKMFLDDVNTTYARLAVRAKEMEKEVGPSGHADDDGEAIGDGEGVEQIQLHAVNPGQEIQIVVPPPLEQCGDDETRASRKVFEGFSREMRKALESGGLDEVNKVLGAMKVDEAEGVVGLLSDGGMLSLQEGVVDATTEEGRRELQKRERNGRIDEVDEVDEKEAKRGKEKMAVDEVD